MTISVSRKLNVLYIMFMIIPFFIKTPFALLYVSVVFLLTYGKHLHDHIISVRGKIWVQKTSLSPPHNIEIPVPSQESEGSCICVFAVSILPLSTILELFRQCGILELFRQCGILESFRQCGNLELFRQCGILELFRQCGILKLFRQCGILELFRQCGILESFRQCGILELFRQCGIL